MIGYLTGVGAWFPVVRQETIITCDMSIPSQGLIVDFLSFYLSVERVLNESSWYLLAAFRTICILAPIIFFLCLFFIIYYLRWVFFGKKDDASPLDKIMKLLMHSIAISRSARSDCAKCNGSLSNKRITSMPPDFKHPPGLKLSYDDHSL